MMQPDLELGNRLFHLRTERKWTQTYLAKLVGTNVKTIKDWENGVSLPTAHNIRKLCSIFSTSSDHLLGIDDVPTISLAGLSPNDVQRAKAIIQVLIDTVDRHNV